MAEKNEMVEALDALTTKIGALMRRMDGVQPFRCGKRQLEQINLATRHVEHAATLVGEIVTANRGGAKA
jgi:hypothetical protein